MAKRSGGARGDGCRRLGLTRHCWRAEAGQLECWRGDRGCARQRVTRCDTRRKNSGNETYRTDEIKLPGKSVVVNNGAEFLVRVTLWSQVCLTRPRDGDAEGATSTSSAHHLRNYGWMVWRGLCLWVIVFSHQSIADTLFECWWRGEMLSGRAMSTSSGQDPRNYGWMVWPCLYFKWLC